MRGDPAESALPRVDPVDTLLEALNHARPSWHDRAACRESGVDFFSHAKTKRAHAFTICARCPVRDECLNWALEIGDETAILGGTDPAARRLIARRRAGCDTGGATVAP